MMQKALTQATVSLVCIRCLEFKHAEQQIKAHFLCFSCICTLSVGGRDSKLFLVLDTTKNS